MTYTVMSRDEYEREYPDEDQEQVNPQTDLENDPEINPSTDVGGDQETSKKLEDILRRMTKGEARRSVRSLDQLHVVERKANQPASAPEPTRGNDIADALVAAMQRAREIKK